ncbi:MAG: GTPase ObgE, partial [Planctomycetes bacterium]|nr:GTPase ObgE [Planctomycetota bacterium]
IPKGGPDGGDGGNGVSVIIRADSDADNLAPLVHRKFYKAEKGEPGGTSLCHGRMGKDIVILVPPGTIIRDRERGNILKDLTESDQELIAAKGGRGGRGNKAFATSTNRAPRQFHPGTPGEERWLSLELKVIADVGLIGLPNAGKSTLLSRLSRATPEIADYPFTTKYPNLGIVTLGGDSAFVMADLPGLIEGAHSGVGLGHAFLRHVERTRVLVHLVEPTPTDGVDPLHHYRVIRKELELYSAALAEKPEFVAITKSELTDSALVRDRLAAELGIPIFAISAVTGQGLPQLVNAVTTRLEELKREERETKTQEVPFEKTGERPWALPVPSGDAVDV